MYHTRREGVAQDPDIPIIDVSLKGSNYAGTVDDFGACSVTSSALFEEIVVWVQKTSV